jgi:hypothetical protein
LSVRAAAGSSESAGAAAGCSPGGVGVGVSVGSGSGSATSRGRAAAKAGVQSTAMPLACASPSEVSMRARPPSRRSDPSTGVTPTGDAPDGDAPDAGAASIVPSTAKVSTGCGLDSTNAVAPSRTSARVACSKRTGSRRLRYQYSGPSSV